MPRQDLSSSFQPEALNLEDLALRATAIVREAALELLMPRFRNLEPQHVQSKRTNEDPHDVVTVVDHLMEQRLSSDLRRLLPNAAVVGEEACSADNQGLAALGTQRLVWLIDPLDGTRNFVEGRSAFGTMVALLAHGSAQLAVIYLPEPDAAYSAIHGGGATLNGAPLRRTASTVDRKLTGMLHTKFLRDNNYSGVLQGRAASLDLLPIVGSAAVAYTDLAEGRCDFSFYARLLPWDHAPGTLLLQESGGKVANLDGSPYNATATRGLLLAATSSRVWREVRAILAPEHHN